MNIRTRDGRTRDGARAALLPLAALALAGATLTACGDEDGPRPADSEALDSEPSTASGSSGSGSGSGSDSDSGSGADSGPDDGTLGLTGTAVYDNKNEVSLSAFSRGVSGAYASPENTPYVKFTLKLKNGTSKVVDVSELSVLCQYGDEAKDGEQIFDSEHGLDGPPQTHLRPGRSITATLACELPKSQTDVQIEVTPDFDTEAAIFAGKVK